MTITDDINAMLADTTQKELWASKASQIIRDKIGMVMYYEYCRQYKELKEDDGRGSLLSTDREYVPIMRYRITYAVKRMLISRGKEDWEV